MLMSIMLRTPSSSRKSGRSISCLYTERPHRWDVYEPRYEIHTRQEDRR